MVEWGEGGALGELWGCTVLATGAAFALSRENDPKKDRAHLIYRDSDHDSASG